jgi:hypothetical protein
LRNENLEHIVIEANFVAAFLSLIVLFTGCVTARIEQSRQNVAGLNDGESVVILPRRQHNREGPEDSFIACLNSKLKRGRKSVRVFPEQDFLDNLFPWFEPRIAPATPDKLVEILARPGVTERLLDTRVRYLVWVVGDTDNVGSGGALSCVVGPAGGGCFGLAWWEKDSEYEVSIWDLRNAESVGTISADVSGTSYLPALILPIPLIARTESTACKELAQQLKELMGTTKIRK